MGAYPETNEVTPELPIDASGHLGGEAVAMTVVNRDDSNGPVASDTDPNVAPAGPVPSAPPY